MNLYKDISTELSCIHQDLVSIQNLLKQSSLSKDEYQKLDSQLARILLVVGDSRSFTNKYVRFFNKLISYLRMN